MTYTLVSVIVLSLVYLVIIFKKYNQVTDANQPHIKQLKQQIEKLTNGIESETKLAKAARLTVEDAKVAVSDIKMQISTAGKELAEEKRREEQLETGRYRKEFKRKS